MVTAYLEDCISGGPNDRAMYLRRREACGADSRSLGSNLTFFPQFILVSGHAAALLGVSSGVPGAERALYRGRVDSGRGLHFAAPLFCLVLKFGEVAGDNLGAAGLEWETTSRHHAHLTSLRW